MRFLVLLFFLLAVSPASAREFYVGIVDLQTLFKEYPGTTPAQNKFNDLAAEKKQDLADMAQNLGELQAKLTKTGSGLSPAKRKLMEKEFATETKDFENEKNHIQVELQDRNQEMTQMLMGQIREVVARIAKKYQVDVVMDKDDVVGVRFGIDLTTEVLRAFAEAKTDTPTPTSDKP